MTAAFASTSAPWRTTDASKSHRVAAKKRIVNYALAIGLAVSPHPDGIKGYRLDAAHAIERAQNLDPPPRRTAAEIAQADADEKRDRHCYRSTLGQVYRTIARHVDEHGVTWISFDLLAFRSHYDVTTVKRAVKALVRLGWLLQLSRWQAHERLHLLEEPRSNLYMLLLRPLRAEHFERMPEARAEALVRIKVEDQWSRGRIEIEDAIDDAAHAVDAEDDLAPDQADEEPTPAPAAAAPSSPPAASRELAVVPPAARRLPVVQSVAAALMPPPEAAERIHAALARLEASGEIGMWTAPGHVSRMFQIALEAPVAKNIATICAAIDDVAKQVRNELALVGTVPDRDWITRKLNAFITAANHVDEPKPEPKPLPKSVVRPRLTAAPPAGPVAVPGVFAAFDALRPPSDLTTPRRRFDEISAEERAELDALAALLPRVGAGPPE